MKNSIIIIALLLLPFTGECQYTTQGKIEYVRTTDVYRQMKDDYGNDSWFEQIKANLPKAKIAYFDLVFNTDKMLYKPGREVENAPNTISGWGNNVAGDDVVLTDIDHNSVTAQKNIYEQKFLIKDSMRQMKWKIMDEIRTIANYKCRKAVGKICDSVYVVAFYTDDIMVSGGPEMFSGLPGMILELAVPRLYTTWVATKVESVITKPEDFTVEQKGKKVGNLKDLFIDLQDNLKDWGKSANRVLWWSYL